MTTFVNLWIGYAIFGSVVLSAIFVWAVRTRQFTELNRQRYIALRAADPLESEKAAMPGRFDRYTWFALALLTLAMVAAGLWVGTRKSRTKLPVQRCMIIRSAESISTPPTINVDFIQRRPSDGA